MPLKRLKPVTLDPKSSTLPQSDCAPQKEIFCSQDLILIFNSKKKDNLKDSEYDQEK